MQKEKRFYPIVERWLKKHFHCFETSVNTGLEYSRIDVVGVRDIGGDLSGDIEVIAIEVKRGTEPFATASGQASGYKVYANRVYLADLRSDDFTEDEIQIAGYLGIGLIRIWKNRCYEILTSPIYDSPANLQLRFLSRLAIAQCRLCGCYFKTGEKGHRQKYTSSESFKNAYLMDKGIQFWNYSIGKRKRNITHPGTPYSTWERRFLCKDCVNHLADWIEGRIKLLEKEE